MPSCFLGVVSQKCKSYWLPPGRLAMGKPPKGGGPAVRDRPLRGLLDLRAWHLTFGTRAIIRGVPIYGHEDIRGLACRCFSHALSGNRVTAADPSSE